MRPGTHWRASSCRSYPCLPRTAGQVLAPTDRFPSKESYLHAPEVPRQVPASTDGPSHRSYPHPPGTAGPGAHWWNSQWLDQSAPLQVSRGGSWGPLAELLVLVAVQALPCQEGWGLTSTCGPGRGGQCPPLEPKMTAGPAFAPGAPVSGVLLPGSTHRERSFYGGPTPLLVYFPIMVPCLSGGTRLLPSTPSVAKAQTLQAVSIPNPCLLSGTELQHLTPTITDRGVNQVGEGRVAVLTLCTGYSPFCLPQTGCCSPLLGSKTPPLLSIISLLVRRLPKVQKIFLLYNSLPGAPVPS